MLMRKSNKAAETNHPKNMAIFNRINIGKEKMTKQHLLRNIINQIFFYKNMLQ